MTVTSKDLNAREGKTLRFLSTRSTPAQPEDCVVTIEWTELPQTVLQAKRALEKLRSLKLAERSKDGYSITQSGRTLTQKAIKAGKWNAQG